jgi:hypothetical protein
VQMVVITCSGARSASAVAVLLDLCLATHRSLAVADGITCRSAKIALVLFSMGEVRASMHVPCG